jgi:hypothetical protein
VPSIGDISVYSCTLSFDNTTSGSYRASSAPRNPARTFSSINVFLKATLNASKKVSLLI